MIDEEGRFSRTLVGIRVIVSVPKLMKQKKLHLRKLSKTKKVPSNYPKTYLPVSICCGRMSDIIRMKNGDYDKVTTTIPYTIRISVRRLRMIHLRL